jgi:Sulfotransferase family
LARDNFRRLAGIDSDHWRTPDHLPGLDGPTLRSMADWHLDRLRGFNEEAHHVVDKMPDNYFYLGLLSAMFPRAKFIHSRRDLRDIAVSCWMTDFRSLRWTSSFEHIAARFHEYERVMNHWRQVLPIPILDVNYEEVVTDLESVARRILSWCGLEWEDACLKFNETKRPVRTFSAMQVRQPIFKQSVARWKNYEKSLGPLFAMLPLKHDETTQLQASQPSAPTTCGLA